MYFANPQDNAIIGVIGVIVGFYFNDTLTNVRNSVIVSEKVDQYIKEKKNGENGGS